MNLHNNGHTAKLNCLLISQQLFFLRQAEHEIKIQLKLRVTNMKQRNKDTNLDKCMAYDFGNIHISRPLSFHDVVSHVFSLV